jgi:N-acyl-D-amino-acid deacylase
MSTLIKNGLVYDGSGGPPEKVDVLIDHGVITRKGILPSNRAEETIDASNAIVTPGFVDVNTSSDHFLSLFTEPEQRSFVSQGVTTIIGGNCGASLAPLLGHSLEEVGDWGHPTHINTDWQTVREFLGFFAKHPLGVNFGTLVGHATIRRIITGGAERDLSEKELKTFEHVLGQAFTDGAFGLSTALGKVHSSELPHRELETLCRIVAKRGRVYATHLRDFREGVLAAVQNALELARTTHVNMELSHLMPRAGLASRYSEALEAIERSAATSFVHFDLYPFDTVEEHLHSILPAWAQHGTSADMRRMLDDSAAVERVVADLRKRDLSNLRIGHVFEHSLRFLEGKKLSDFAGSHELPMPEAVIRLLVITNLKGTALEQIVDAAVLERMMQSPSALIASNAASVEIRDFSNERTNATFTTFLAWAAKSPHIELERAVARITAVPAQKYGISRRGKIAEGYAADLVVLRAFKPTHVFVNGTLAVSGGEPTGARAGLALRSAS